MKVVCVGGGVAGLYFALLLKKAYPDCQIDIFERNRSDDAFGWGVVFSSETLSNFEEADQESYHEIRQNFRYWDNIDTFRGGPAVTSSGHSFCGLSRKVLLHILQRRCASLGVQLHFQHEIADLTPLLQYDLVLGTDGINSRVREHYSEHYKPRISWGRNRFTWLGTTLPLSAFTFFYRNSEHGLFQVHAYPFQSDLSTFIVECHEDVWRRAGLDKASEEETVAYCQSLFAAELAGHPLLSNRSIWRSFPTIECERWHHGNVVLLGDAAHTAHFSIGSGTKLAMEDAIALVAAFQKHGLQDVRRVLCAYEESRRIDVQKLQKAAHTSLSWFENCVRYQRQHPIQFTFNQTTRSQRITWENLAQRDPAFIARVRKWYADEQGAPCSSDGSAPPPMFTPFRLRGLSLRNRVVVSPMCMYSAEDGLINDWHLVHLGSRAIGGAGLIVTEMTDVSAQGRISPGCAGMYRPEHRVAWQRVVEFVHRHSAAKIALQLGHAGRKGSTRLSWEGADEPLTTGNWPILGPSPLPYLPHSQVPRPMERSDMDAVREEFVRAARWAEEAGFDMLEIHMAHGYLLASFISPLTNQRTDAYGGSLENRMRYPLEVFSAVRAAFPAEKPISVRISATDWAPHGLFSEDAVQVAKLLKEHGADIIDVSTGQTVAESRPLYGRMYQVPFSDQIRHEAGIPTMAVGSIFSADHCNTILAAGRADLCVLARQHLREPYFTLDAAQRYEYPDQPWPPQYGAARPSPHTRGT
jgi:anthraniloyl-CoA monooxygenase